MSFRPSVRMTVERNPNYGKPGLPYLDEIETFGIPNPQARLNALSAGDTEFIKRIDPRQMSLIEQSSNAKMAAAKAGRHTTTGLMCDHAPFKDNVDLRLALKYAIDREGILRNVRRGYGTIANDHPLSPFDPYYCRDLPQRTYDPDRAKFHLKNTGLSSFDVVLTTSDAVGSEGPDLAVHFRQTAAPCGINIQVKKEPVDGYWSNVWMNRPRSMGTYLPRATADQVLSLAHSSGAKWNGARFENPRIDQLPAEGRRTLDQAKRRQVHCDLQRIINEDGGSIIPMFLDCLDARAAKLGGYEPHPVGEAGGCRMTEKIWMQA